MIGEFERPLRRRAAQDRALHRYLRTQVQPYSPRYGALLDATPVNSVGDLATLPLESLGAMAGTVDPAELVLRPSSDRIQTSPDLRFRMRYLWARTLHRLSSFNREVIEPAYKPIHWHLAVDGQGPPLPVGYSADDLDRLAEIGRATLEMAGAGPSDVLVGFQPAAPVLEFWQIALGARRSGISALFLDEIPDADRLAQLRPNVLAGRPGDLLRLLDEGRARGLSFASLHTLLVVGAPLDPATRSRLAETAGGQSREAAVVSVWGPPGVRALWSECREGTDAHTWPAHEVLEMIDPLSGTVVAPGIDGEVVYTPLGWSGSVVLRLRTGAYGCLDDTPCVSCGRTSPRVRLVPFLPPFARILDNHPGVLLWQAELRTAADTEELIVFLTPSQSGHPGPLLRELDRQLSVTQFVVLDKAALTRRLRATADARVVDRRE